LTHLERQSIDLERARSQHRAYCTALVELGCRIREIEELPDYPDSVFVEDSALVFDELAILTRPGAESRRGEVQSVAEALSPYRTIERITAPATLDGGDVIVVGSLVLVGRTSRTSSTAIGQLETLLHPHGYQVIEIEVTGCLHLKTAATAIAEDALLVNPEWVDVADFGALETVSIDPREPFAANSVRIASGLLYSSCYPHTLDRLKALGLDPELVDASELSKAEGALSCCSLIFKTES
jgi:dimethylargininase